MARVKLTLDVSRIDRLRSRPDFQQNAARALARRLYYRVRWAVTEKPWRLKLGEDLDVLAPKGGAGALIYYLGYSEPETAAFVTRFLKPGMVFWDVGAHIGEYSLLASRRVGATGRVEALEPQPKIQEFLKANIELNHFSNIRPHWFGAAAHSGEATLVLVEEPSMAHLTSSPATGSSNVRIPTISLDAFLAFTGKVPDLVKVDVEGAEKLVLMGSHHLLNLAPDVAPTWVVEYAPENCQSFGYEANELIELFSSSGFSTFWLGTAGELVSTAGAPPWRSSGNFVATKRDARQ